MLFTTKLSAANYAPHTSVTSRECRKVCTTTYLYAEKPQLFHFQHARLFNDDTSCQVKIDFLLQALYTNLEPVTIWVLSFSYTGCICMQACSLLAAVVALSRAFVSADDLTV